MPGSSSDRNGIYRLHVYRKEYAICEEVKTKTVRLMFTGTFRSFNSDQNGLVGGGVSQLTSDVQRLSMN